MFCNVMKVALISNNSVYKYKAKHICLHVTDYFQKKRPFVCETVSGRLLRAGLAWLTNTYKQLDGGFVECSDRTTLDEAALFESPLHKIIRLYNTYFSKKHLFIHYSAL